MGGGFPHSSENEKRHRNTHEAAAALLSSRIVGQAGIEVENRSVADAVKLRILIAEDNQDSADSLKMLLEALGFEAQISNDGESAVRTAAQWQPDAILMDIGLPGLNGYDATRRIRATRNGKKVMIIALTGWGQESDRQRSVEAGIDHHLVKPLDLARLQRLLETLRPAVPR